jgi:branched-chain amino acid transport system permease protein
MFADFDKKELTGLAFLLFLGISTPYLFSGYRIQMAELFLFMVYASTWNIQGGKMGYNTFGNIVFFGVGMYICASTQIAVAFPLGEWTAAGGYKTFVHTPQQYFLGIPLGILLAGIVPAIIALIIGSALLVLRGHYFAIGTLGLGIASGEFATSLEIIGGGQGMTVPFWPKVAGLPHAFLGGGVNFFFTLSFLLFLSVFFFLRWLYKTRFGLILTAIRDNEDKAESMGIPTMHYKVMGWVFSAFFMGIAGGIFGNINGYIEPTEVAFAGATVGVFMVLMTILGGKGTLWGPIIGAFIFQLFKEFFWTYFLGWQLVALGALIIGIIIFFPEGIMGMLRHKYPALFGEVVDEEARLAQVTINTDD